MIAHILLAVERKLPYTRRISKSRETTSKHDSLQKPLNPLYKSEYTGCTKKQSRKNAIP